MRFVADFGQKERINVATCSDKVDVAADAGLCRVNVAEIVGAVDDPEFLVACREVQDLLISWKHNEGREADFGENGNDVGLRILDDSCGIRRSNVGTG